MTYLLACSKPIRTFISSSCRCTTIAEFDKMAAAGCFPVRTPSGSSGTLTGEKRLLSWLLAFLSAAETASAAEAGFPADSFGAAAAGGGGGGGGGLGDC